MCPLFFHHALSVVNSLPGLISTDCACVRAGADEDVEAVMARLAAQSAENAVLRERQAKLDKDQQVRVLHCNGCANSGSTWVILIVQVGLRPAGESVPLRGCANSGST